MISTLLALALGSLGCEGTTIYMEAPGSSGGSGGPGGGPTGIVGGGSGGPGGTSGGGGATGGGGMFVDVCEGPQAPGDAPMRALTGAEYQLRLEQLFPGQAPSYPPLGRDQRVGTFAHNASGPIEANQVEAFRLAAEAIAPQLAENWAEVTGCGAADAACVANYIELLGARAFRRPLIDAERNGLAALYVQGSSLRDAGGTPIGNGLSYVFEAILQAPSFIYVYEELPAQGAERALGDMELAHRMASTLWRGIPDQALLEAAIRGDLADPELRAQQARRMMQDEKARVAFNDFVLQWLGVDPLADQAFAQDDDGRRLAQSMMLETESLIDHVLQNEGADWRVLLEAPYTFVDARMAEHLGVEIPDDGGVHRVETPERRGVLTHSSALAMHHGPVHRGLFVRKALLCGDVPGPNGVDVSAVETFETEAERSKADKRLAHGTCGGCHLQMDPFGLTFDVFDDLGRPRAIDKHGNDLFSDGAVFGTDVDGDVADANELAQRMASSEDVRACVAQHVFTWAFARKPDVRGGDACAVKIIDDALVTHDGDLTEAFVAATQTTTFTQLAHTPATEQ